MISKKQKLKSRGFTLIESLIAFSLLIFAILASGSMITMGIKLQAFQKNALLAQNIANEIFNNEVLNKSFATLILLPDDVPDTEVTDENNVTNGVYNGYNINNFFAQTPSNSHKIELNMTTAYQASLKKIYNAKAFIRLVPIQKDLSTPSYFQKKVYATVIVLYGNPARAFKVSSVIASGGLTARGL